MEPGDAVIGMESTFVVVGVDKKNYHVPNVDRAILSRYFDKPITITGMLDPKSSTIMADKIDADGRTVWSKEMAAKADQYMYGLFLKAQQ
jgi:hypothetical protein